MSKPSTNPESVRQALHELGFPVHHGGYRRLCAAIPRYAQDPEQSLTKELYPDVARELGCTNPCDVESSIRRAILTAWDQGDRDVWIQYFPRCRKAPTNLVFIATLAEYLK